MNTPDANLFLSRFFWFCLVGELRRRGIGRRESGAFLLGPPESRRVCLAAYYDDLDSRCLDDGYIHFDGSGYAALSKLCHQNGLKVLGDVHTHPGSGTGQSPDDRAYPMMPRCGHLGLIVPHYARANRFNLHGVRAFLYLGEGEWTECRSGVKLVWI